jgi:pyridoxal phosphate enzyme (YggS family)
MTDDQYAPETMRERLESVEERLTAAAERSGRSRDDIELVAVSKTHPVSAIQTLYEAGVHSFGASYVQEWEDKFEALPDDVRWHFVGHLQSNKAKYVADDVAMVHSVDRRSVMKQLHRRSSGDVDVLIQVNVAEDDDKSGVAPDGLEDLLGTTLEYPSLRLRGLMTLPPYEDDPEDNRPRFEQLRHLFDEARQWIASSGERDASIFEHLSMGMTHDFDVAVEEGATIVRLGTALFGPRDYD